MINLRGKKKELRRDSGKKSSETEPRESMEKEEEGEAGGENGERNYDRDRKKQSVNGNRRGGGVTQGPTN